MAAKKPKRKKPRPVAEILLPPPGQPRLPMREAVARAGSLAALLPLLIDGRIMARAKDFFTWPAGGAVKMVDRNIPLGWWRAAHSIDAAAGRA